MFARTVKAGGLLRKLISIALSLFFLGACQTPNFAQNIKFVSFNDSLIKGKSIGNVHGEDCTWMVLGYSTKGYPTLSNAMINLRTGAGSLKTQLGLSYSEDRKGGGLAYVTKLQSFFSAIPLIFVNKYCIEVTGVGYIHEEKKNKGEGA